MSILPLLTSLARELYEQQETVSNWDDFGFGIYPCDIYRPRVASLQVSPRRRFSPYQRSYQIMQGKHDTRDIPSVGKDGFQVCMDVSHFKPNELTVKTVGNHVVVEGKHEDREDDHGSISRQFVRKYHLPKGYDAKDVVSTISTDGILTVKSPPPAKALKSNERIVQIQQTGPAHLNVRHNREEESNDVEINKTPNKKTDGKQQS